MKNIILSLIMLSMIGIASAAVQPVDLGTAKNFAILTQTGTTDIPMSNVTGDVGASPITGGAILLTCSEVTGTVYSVDTGGPMPCRIINPTLLAAAVNDMGAAYADATSRPATYTNIGGGNIGHLTLSPGVYAFAGAVSIPADVTLNGSSTDVWIFNVPGTLGVTSGQHVLLTGGADANNVFWRVGGATTIGTYSLFQGNLLDATSVAVQTGATIHGRLLAQTAVTLDTDTIALPTTTTTTSTTTTLPAGRSGGGGSYVNLYPTSSANASATTATTATNGQVDSNTLLLIAGVLAAYYFLFVHKKKI